MRAQLRGSAGDRTQGRARDEAPAEGCGRCIGVAGSGVHRQEAGGNEGGGGGGGEGSGDPAGDGGGGGRNRDRRRGARVEPHGAGGARAGRDGRRGMVGSVGPSGGPRDAEAHADDPQARLRCGGLRRFGAPRPRNASLTPHGGHGEGARGGDVGRPFDSGAGGVQSGGRAAVVRLAQAPRPGVYGARAWGAEERRGPQECVARAGG